MYYRENLKKLLVTIFTIMFSAILAVAIYYHSPIFKENEKISIKGDYIIVDSSFITKHTHDSSLVSPSNTQFIIVSLDTSLKIDDFYLVASNHIYENHLELVDYFNDLGKNIFVSIISEQDMLKNFKLMYDYKNKYFFNKLNIILEPIILDEKKKVVNTYQLNDDLYIDSLDIAFKVTNYEINNKYIYTYKINDQNINSILTSKEDLLLKLTLKDSMIQYINLINVKYILNDIEYTSKCINKTPSPSTENIYLLVDNKIKDATSIWLEIEIRNKLYKYYLY